MIEFESSFVIETMKGKKKLEWKNCPNAFISQWNVGNGAKSHSVHYKKLGETFAVSL